MYVGVMRTQRARGATTRELVVGAALELADEVGIEALSIRALAKRVGVAPMSLYSHFSNKEALLDLMYLEVAKRLYADDGHPTWQRALEALCYQVRSVMLQHPRWAPLLGRPAAPKSVALRERIVPMMVDDGMAPEQALAILASASLFALGQALVELNYRDPSGGDPFSKRFERIKSWTHDSTEWKSEVTQQAFAQTRRFDLTSTFELSVRIFVAGLEHQRNERRSRDEAESGVILASGDYSGK